MPPVDEPETPPAAPPAPPPPPVTPAKSLYLSTAAAFGCKSGSVWALTPAQAGEGGDALRPIAADDPALAVWGRAPLVRD